MEHLLNKIRL